MAEDLKTGKQAATFTQRIISPLSRWMEKLGWQKLRWPKLSQKVETVMVNPITTTDAITKDVLLLYGDLIDAGKVKTLTEDEFKQRIAKIRGDIRRDIAEQRKKPPTP